MATEIKQVKKNDLPSIDVKDIDDRVADKLRRFIADKNAFAKNTWDQMLSVLRSWGTWCDAQGKTWLPADPDDVREYLFYLKNDLKRATSTVAQHKYLINKIHVEAGLPRPGDDLSVRRGMRSIRRTSVLDGERVGQAIPFHYEDLKKVATLWHGSKSLKIRRNLAFVGIAYNTLLRIAEVSRLRVRDIHFLPDGTAIVNVGYTKTIVNNRGVVKKLAPQVTAWLSEWLEIADLATKPDAFIFCRVDRYNYAHVARNPMGHKAIETIFADAWCALHGKPAASDISRYRTWTGHSARVGATQDMATNGVPLTQIMHEGTWKRPEQVLSYIRNTEADKSAMLSMFRGG